MTLALRERIRTLHDGTCGYCGVSETGAGASLTIDHFRPRAQGGTDEEENLVLCCHACNEFKGDFWPVAGQLMLIHPRSEDIRQFVREREDGTLVALQPRGEAHIACLRLNRLPSVARRLELQRQARLLTALETALARIQEAEERARRVENALESWRSLSR